tara:strand:- start:2373 stop:2570 length:198 start_codon:yes stop_codon:yes gene_type:complete
MVPEDNSWSVNYSWSQPYTNWNHPISSVQKEMSVIEAIDNLVNAGLTHPKADAILKALVNNTRSK